MTHANESSSQPASEPTDSLTVRMIIGAIAGVLIACFFVFGVDDPNPAWGEYWRIRPLIIIPFAGAMGGLCNYLIMQYRWLFGIHKVIAIIISALVALVGMWMGIVLGLDGTLWD